MASVLKPENLSTANGAFPEAYNAEDIRARATKYLAEAQLQAKQLIESASDEAATIRETARVQGLADANAEFEASVLAKAAQISEEKCRTAVDTCAATVSQLTEESTRWLTEWRNQTVELAVRMAEKVIRQQLVEQTTETLCIWLEEALLATQDSREVRFFVNPDDLAVAGRFLQHLAQSTPHAKQAEVIADESISHGECLAKSSHGQLDFRVDAQLNRLAQQLV